MDKIKFSDKDIKFAKGTVEIIDNSRAAGSKIKEVTNDLLEHNESSAEEYSNEIFDDMVSDTSDSAQAFTKNKYIKTVQNKRRAKVERIKFSNAVDSSTNEQTIKGTEKAVERAKQKVINTYAKAKGTGTVTIKQRVIDFIKVKPAAALNTAKTAIANTQILFTTVFSGVSVASLFAILICLIGLVCGSSFGIFMSTEDTGTGYTLTAVMEEINTEYLEEIEKIKTENSHDKVTVSDVTPNWKDILAIYSVKITTGTDGAEVVTIDEEKKELICQIFWDMTELEYHTETYMETVLVDSVDEEGNPIQVEQEESRTHLIIETKNKTATEMAVEYDFDNNQVEQLNELLDSKNNGLWEGLVNIE